MTRDLQVGDLVQTKISTLIGRVEAVRTPFVDIQYVGRWMDRNNTVFQKRESWRCNPVTYYAHELVLIENPELLELVINFG